VTKACRSGTPPRSSVGTEPAGDLHLPEEAEGHFGLFAQFAAFDVLVSSALTQQRFGWHSSHPGLIADLDEGHYFTGL
jgi:hypothetical protein